MKIITSTSYWNCCIIAYELRGRKIDAAFSYMIRGGVTHAII
jgi:hypothetical protein